MSKWYKASELERLNTPMPMDGVNGLPDNHVITVSERTIEIDESELVQNNVSTDTFTLELDAEWDDITPVVIFSNSKGDYKVAYENGPTKIPAAAMAVIGSVDVSVFGLDSTGEVRVVTKAAPNTMDVVESGKFVGQVSSDDVSLLGQILQAVSDANAAAETANTAAVNAGTTVNQLKESVETFLSQSQTSVNNAVSSAGKATSAANTAAQTANTAANNADNSADTADAAATKANTSASRAENAYTTLQPILADISVSGNQPRKTLSGNIVSANDAWPAKPLGIRVKGKTRQNLWVNPKGTSNGITVTANGNGSFTIGGTLEGTSAGLRNTGNIYTLMPNTRYTLSIDKPIAPSYATGVSGACVYVNALKADGTYLTDYPVGYGDLLSVSFTTGPEFSYFIARIQVYSNDFNPGTYRVMLNEGDTAEPWCPPGLNSVDELSVVTAGKNLLNEEMSGIEYTANMGVSIDIPCPTSLSRQTVVASVYKDGKKLPFNNSSSSFALYIGVTDSVSNSAGNIVQGPGRVDTITLGDVVAGSTIRFVANSNFSDQNCNIDVQLELGSTATAYEPPNVTTTPLPEVELRSLPNGMCDELVIGADGTCRVERKTKAIELDGSLDEIINLDTTKEKTQVFHISTGSHLNALLNVICDILPTGSGKDIPSISGGGEGGIYIAVDKTDASTVVEFRAWLAEHKPKIVYLVGESAEPLPPVTLPVLPAPTFNAYHDSDVPSDTSTTYTRDINIALADLEAKIADLVTKEAANV